ncbi:hypothetical protein COT98_04355 [Candidatus Falkowbacteria bacterium CG10_big_fil_rev_8_21_14_0_10_39_9]|uniref:Uncharacterized protein n=1 Tax=Candidatus Falkowbacteria bacterium CG10_big_fil_rev_8_21_14_0_10_39_9 TaxID=1974566 RepID=A0A2M6WNA4_9BACT|nr:MAG: hypothetical protein COT98_04355 [Candidatus Falkowbacteria bacterium CG10_big_fil_rev_8_21_14_0_10_39_9]
MKDFKEYKTLGTAWNKLAITTAGSEAEFFYLKNCFKHLNFKRWAEFNDWLEAHKDILPSVKKIITANPSHLSGAIFLSEGKMLKFYLGIADEFFPPSQETDFWARLINENNPELSLEALNRILPYEKDTAVLRKAYLIYGDQMPIIGRILSKTECLEDIEFIQTRAPEYFQKNLMTIAEKAFSISNRGAKSYFETCYQTRKINVVEWVTIKQLFRETEKAMALSDANGKFNKLIIKYQKIKSTEEKQIVIEDICFQAKTIEDFSLLLEAAEKNQLGLTFSRAVVDAFFRCCFQERPLITIYRQIKDQAIKSYFVGSLFNQKIPFKSLDFLFNQSQDDPEFSQIILKLMIEAADNTEHFLVLLNKGQLDESQELSLLSEIKHRKSGVVFWTRVLRQARPKSRLEASATNIVEKAFRTRTFKQTYDLYLQETNKEGKVGTLMLKVLVKVIKNKDELKKFLFIAPKEMETLALEARARIAQNEDELEEILLIAPRKSQALRLAKIKMGFLLKKSRL